MATRCQTEHTIGSGYFGCRNAPLVNSSTALVNLVQLPFGPGQQIPGCYHFGVNFSDVFIMVTSNTNTVLTKFISEAWVCGKMTKNVWCVMQPTYSHTIILILNTPQGLAQIWPTPYTLIWHTHCMEWWHLGDPFLFWSEPQAGYSTARCQLRVNRINQTDPNLGHSLFYTGGLDLPKLGPVNKSELVYSVRACLISGHAMACSCQTGVDYPSAICGPNECV